MKIPAPPPPPSKHFIFYEQSQLSKERPKPNLPKLQIELQELKDFKDMSLKISQQKTSTFKKKAKVLKKF